MIVLVLFLGMKKSCQVMYQVMSGIEKAVKHVKN